MAATPAPETQATDLFGQLELTQEAAVPAQQPAPQATPTPETQDAARQGQEAEEQARLLGQWLGRAWPLLLICLLVAIMANTWLSGGQIGYLAKRVTTQQANIAEFWIAGTRAFGALLGAWFISVLALGALALAFVLIIWLFSALANAVPDVVLVILGLLLGLAALIGLIWLGVRLVFWYIAIVVEKLGPIAGLKAGFRATRGRWWRVAGLGLLMVLISFGVSVPFGLLEWLGNTAGGTTALVMGILSNVLGTVASLFVGFVMLAAYIRFYEDVKSASVSASASRVAQ
jgi:hypothetical protein